MNMGGQFSLLGMTRRWEIARLRKDMQFHRLHVPSLKDAFREQIPQAVLRRVANEHIRHLFIPNLVTSSSICFESIRSACSMMEGSGAPAPVPESVGGGRFTAGLCSWGFSTLSFP